MAIRGLEPSLQPCPGCQRRFLRLAWPVAQRGQKHRCFASTALMVGDLHDSLTSFHLQSDQCADGPARRGP